MPRSSQRSPWILACGLLPLLAAAITAGLYLASFVPLRAPDQTRFPIRGIDVSHHQGEVDWNSVREDNIRFAFIKATEGRDFSDPRFAKNWESAGHAGIPRGAYHFFTFCTPGAAQAKHFLKVVPPGEGELPPVVDVEFTGNCTSWESLEQVRTELKHFLDALRRAGWREPLIYLNRPSFRKIVRGHFSNSPLWVRDLFFEPRVTGYGAWHFWQFSDSGEVAGVQGPVDLNVFSGDAVRFAQLVR